MRVILFCLLLLWHDNNNVYSKKVAIIGAGIAGGSTAYYTNKFAPGTEIHVFEKENRIGGRMKHVQIGGEVCEVGADAWSSVNEYLVELAEALKIPLDNSGFDGNGKLGFYEGDGKWYSPRRDFPSEAHLFTQIELFRYKLHNNYAERDKKNTPFKSIEEFVTYGGIQEYTSITTTEFARVHDIKPEFLWGEILPVIRGIYDQDLSISAFAGIVSILPSVTEAFSVLGGNSILVEKLIDISSAVVNLNSTIAKISKVGSSYQLYSDQGVIPNLFDDVVVAFPIEFSPLMFVNISIPSISPRKYQHWFVTLILAQSLNPSYFGNISPLPDNIFTTGNTTAPFVVVYPVAQTKAGFVVFKIFSNEDVQSILNNIFIGVQDHVVQVWPRTFPDLTPQASYQPLVWGPGLYYVSGMESVATAMECSTIAGRNIALLISEGA